MISSTMAEMQHRSKHNAEDEIASPRNRVNGNADPHSRIVRNAKLCVLILLFIILPSCKHGSCKECRSLVGQNDRYKYSNTKCNYFHQKFCKFRKYFCQGWSPLRISAKLPFSFRLSKFPETTPAAASLLYHKFQSLRDCISDVLSGQ